MQREEPISEQTIIWVKLAFPVQAPVHLKLQEMKLQKKEATPMMKLSDLLS